MSEPLPVIARRAGSVWSGGKNSGSVAFTFPSVAGVTNSDVEKVPVPGLPAFVEEPETAEAWQPMQLIAVGPLNENCGSGHPPLLVAAGVVALLVAAIVIVEAADPQPVDSVPTTAQDHPSHQRFESLVITLQNLIGEVGSSSQCSSLMTTEPSGIGPCRFPGVIHL